MVFSIGCEYAIRAMTFLAEHHAPGDYCLLRTITNDHKLPQHFVGKIFQSLVRAGLLYSAKGRGGGFALRRPPGEIRLEEIVLAIDGPERMKRCVLGLDHCDDEQACPLHDQWKPVSGQIDQMLRGTTLAQLAEASAAKRRALLGGGPIAAAE